jgi:endonuclease/exonuclease/phosphatase family metal-dependent hydrolase
MELTLLTINTWKCDGDYYIRRAVLLSGLAAAGAQVILCQECFRSADGQTDTLEYLAAGLGMTAYFVPARRKERVLDGERVDSFSGLGILTSLPVSDQATIDLPAAAADGDRKAQLLTLVPQPGEKILIANIHLTHLQDDRLRREQLSALLEAIQNNDADIRLIGGDWNAEADSSVLHDTLQAVRALDCYRLGGGKGPGVSLLESLRNDRPICVDHFFALPGPGQQAYPSVLRADILLDKPDAATGLYPSDHFGIRITLLID